MRLAFDRRLTLTVDDGEQAVEVQFVSVQAARVTTVDAFQWPGLLPADGVYEVVASPWIPQLRAVLAEADPDASFLDDAHHYLVVGYDDVAEVISRDAPASIRPTIVTGEPLDPTR